MDKVQLLYLFQYNSGQNKTCVGNSTKKKKATNVVQIKSVYDWLTVGLKKKNRWKCILYYWIQYYWINAEEGNDIF